MTAAEYQSQFGSKGTATATKRPSPSPVPPASIGGRGGQENPKSEILSLPTPAYADTLTNSATWLFDGGRTSLSLARPHGRQRMAICGAPDEALVAVVVAAIEKHFNQPNKP